MKALTCSGLAALALTLAGCGGGEEGNAQQGASNAPLTQIAAPNGDWSQVVNQSPEGGFVMGNPNAPVKLVEFGSMTCGHCATFAAEGEPALIDKYVKSGQVSFEFRNFVRDAADIAAALIARCNGPSAFFPLTDQLFAAQKDWLGALSSMPRQQAEQMASLSPQQQVAAYAQIGGLDQFARTRGIPAAKAQSCLADQAALQRLVDMGQKAAAQYKIPGTPAFAINGRLVEDAADWKMLEPKLQAALR